MQASAQHWRRISDEPERGDILDAKGNLLAGTTYVYTVGITPSDFHSTTKNISAEEIATNVAQCIGVDTSVVTAAAEKTDSSYVQLAKNLDKEKIDALKEYLSDNSVGGTKIDSVAKRFYSNGDLASQIIGYATATDGLLVGQLGIEAEYNQELTGKEGYSYVEVDNYTGSALPYSAPTTILAEDGYNVVLNIDKNIQKITDTACQDVYENYNVIEGVTAIVMNPYTGAVLGMSSYPNFDPNNPTAEPTWISPDTWNAMKEDDQIKLLISKAWRNRAISDTYEPGSTFKALTTAIALEEGLTNEDEVFNDAPIKSGDYTISCWREKEGGNHGLETLKQAFENSCNPIFVQLSQRIGITKYYEYVHNFGFYNTTGIDLPAEGVGIFHKNPTLIDMQTLSFGESSTVTPLQLANVYCALVNGGTLMTPQVAKCLTDDTGNVVKEYEPKAIRTIFSESTAARVRELMKGVVMEGTGTAGYVEGYNVAGKTSTSTIETGEYAGHHVLSFGCYAPSDNPQIVVLVVVNMPSDKEQGSSCATKTAASIVSQTLDYMGIEHEYTDNDYTRLTTAYQVPDVSGMTYKEAKRTLYLDAGSFLAVKGSEDIQSDTVVQMMYPTAGSALYKGATIVLYAATDATRIQTALPDFTGKTIAECIREANASGVNIQITGDPKGVVTSQNPKYALPSQTTGTPVPTAGDTPTPAGDSPTPTGEPTPTGGAEDTTQPTIATSVEKGTVVTLTMA